MPRHPKFIALADVVIGAHGAFADWIFALVDDLATAAGRSVQRIDRFHQFDFSVDPRPVFLTCYPGTQLIQAIERGDVRVLFLNEPPVQTLRYMQRSLNVPVMDAIRSQTASAVANLAIGRSEHSRVVERDTERTVTQLADLIATHLELRISETDFLGIVTRAAGNAGPSATPNQVLAPAAVDLAVAGEGLDRRMDRACQDILEPLLAMARFEGVRPIVWPTEVFTFYDSPGAPPPAEPAIAGPSRNLYYGPYLYLPPASYRVEALLVFSEDIGAVPFVLEVHAGSWLARARIEERQPGRFRGYFQLEHHEATSTVEIRLRNETPVQSGRLALVELLFFAN